MSETIGNRSTFALEFQLGEEIPRLWNEWWGFLWLWVEGRRVGNPDAMEMIATGLDSLREPLVVDRVSASAALAGLGAAQALSLVMQARYGDVDGDQAQDQKIDEDLLSLVEVLPLRSGPFFDGWEAILLDEGPFERIIYRFEEGQIEQALWPRGTFGVVIGSATRRFKSITEALLKNDPSVC